MKYLLALTLLIFAGCSKKDNPEPGSLSDRQLVLNSLGHNVIIRGFLDLQNAVNALKEYSNAYAADSANAQKLLILRNEWLKTAVAWKSASVFLLGSVDDQFVSKGIDAPANVPGIEGTISNGTQGFDPVYMQTLPAGHRGILAIEYLIYGNNNGDANTVMNAFQTAGGRRAAYLRALCTDLQTHTDLLLYKWSTGGDAYVNTFIASDGTSGNASLALLGRQMLTTVAQIKTLKLGAPNGINHGGVPQPELVESKFGGGSIALLTAELRGVFSAFSGIKAGTVGSSGMKLLLDHLNVRSGSLKLSEQITLQFTNTISKLDLIESPLEKAVVSNPGQVTAAYAEMEKLEVLMQEMLDQLNFD